MPGLQLRSAHHRRALVTIVLLVGALLCFGLGQVLGHPLGATSADSSAATQSQVAARQVTPASGALAATPGWAIALPLAAPPSRATAREHNHAKPDRSPASSTRHSDHGAGDQQGAASNSGGSQHGNGQHDSNGNGNGGNVRAIIRAVIALIG